MVKLSLLCILLSLSQADSFSQYLDVNSLKRIDSLSVWIESLNADMEGTGITKEGLKNDIANRLRDAGFKIVEGAPDNVYLTVTTTRDVVSGNFACNIKLDYLQGVWLERTDEWNYASTWFREYLGIYSEDRIAAEVRTTVSDLMALFIHDARSVNPRPLQK